MYIGSESLEILILSFWIIYPKCMNLYSFILITCYDLFQKYFYFTYYMKYYQLFLESSFLLICHVQYLVYLS